MEIVPMEYVGKHRGPAAADPYPPPGYDLYGQPVCTCAVVIGDMPVYSPYCRRHGHMSPRHSWTTPGITWPPTEPLRITCASIN